MKYLNALITGGAGFIGSHLTKIFVEKYPLTNFYVLDNLTYAGNLRNLYSCKDHQNFKFIKADICDKVKIPEIIQKNEIDLIIHLAAESHVDNSIGKPLDFVNTNVIGTLNLLDAAKEYWGNLEKDTLFYHVSTDEVYGSLGDTGYFNENSKYSPNSPYSASKASSDHFVRAYGETYKLTYLISNCSNNYGPNQFPEKLIPLFIDRLINQKKLPLYGNGTNVRDWIFVEDHVRAIDILISSNYRNETFLIGGEAELSNIKLTEMLCDLFDKVMNNKKGKSREQISFVEDRKGHDFRYAIDNKKIKECTEWQPSFNFEVGLNHTLLWYLDNKNWLNEVRSGNYRKIEII